MWAWDFVFGEDAILVAVHAIEAFHAALLAAFATFSAGSGGSGGAGGSGGWLGEEGEGEQQGQLDHGGVSGWMIRGVGMEHPRGVIW